MTDKPSPPDVVATIARHGSDMQRVNDKLRDLISTLRTSKDRLAGSLGTTMPEIHLPASMAPMAPPAANEPALELENRRLTAELAMAREQLSRAAAEREELRKHLDELEVEHRHVCDQFVEAEAQASEMVQAHATLQQIHGADGLEALLQALQEVVINVVGSEELAIFQVEGGELRLARAFGVDAGPLQRIPLGQGVIGRAAERGTIYVAGREGPPEDDLLTACVPLKAGGKVVGLIAIYRLLGHKPGLGPSDQALFELLTTHAGQALALRRKAGPAA